MQVQRRDGNNRDGYHIREGVLTGVRQVPIKKLSEIEIDADKDWLGYQIESPGAVDGVDVGTHDHSGVAGHGPVLDGANCLKNVDLDLGTGGVTTSKTVTKHVTINALSLGRPPVGPPDVDVYGITGVLEFTVDTDKAYYIFHLPPDWAPGTDLNLHFHWTRSSTGADESTKTVKWQLKYLAINGQSENCNSGEATLSVQDTYDSAVAADQIVYESGEVTIPAASLAAADLVILEVMAIAPTGTALTAPALTGMGFSYTIYQVIPP